MILSSGTTKQQRGSSTSDSIEDEMLTTLLDTLSYSRKLDYTGWDYCDGMSSRIRRALPIENRWINLVFQESAKRAPVNVRPLLLVERRRNFMSAGLFAMANLIVNRLEQRGWNSECSGQNVDFADEAITLLDWLLQNRCRGYAGFCGSHQHKTQSLTSTGDTNTPSIVSTAFPARALLRGADLDPVYGVVGRTSGDFVISDLDYRERAGGATIKYLPTDSREYLTPNAMAIGARLLTDLYAATGTEDHAERAAMILDFVVELQTDDGGWMYRHPPEASHLSMDNFHNGFIIESLLRYDQITGESRYDSVLTRALNFYRETLFNSDGAPNWDESSRYPRDIHASAQGILVFSHAGEFERAKRIYDWAIEHLYAGDGRFYFRKGRLYTKKITLMRWCQAWMAYAMAEFLALRAFEECRP